MKIAEPHAPSKASKSCGVLGSLAIVLAWTLTAVLMYVVRPSGELRHAFTDAPLVVAQLGASVASEPRVRFVGELTPLPKAGGMTMAICVVEHWHEFVHIIMALRVPESPSEKETSTKFPHMRIWKDEVASLKSFSGMSPDFVYYLDVHVPNMKAAEALVNTPEYVAANAVYVVRCENKTPARVMEMLQQLKPVPTRVESNSEIV